MSTQQGLGIFPPRKGGRSPPSRLQGGNLIDPVTEWPQQHFHLLVHFVQMLSLSGVGISYREIIECRYIGLFSISKSILYRTSHIEYLDILKTSDFFVFFRRKFSENSENSPKILKTHEPKSSTTTTTTTTPKIPKIRQKF